jgi:transglutaminase-like putative cysteine protease
MATVVFLVVAAAVSWSSLIAVPAIRFAAAVALTALPALLAVSGPSRPAATMLSVLCVPGLMLVSGVPVGDLAPQKWPQLLVHLGSGAAPFVAPGSRPGAAAWSLSAVLLASGALWMAAATIAPSSQGSTQRLIIAFILFAGPWLAGVCEKTPDHAAWLGALVLLAGVLWFSSAAVAIALGMLTALLSIAVAQAVGPHTRWFGLGQRTPDASTFRRLDTDPTYGPLTDRRTGAPMLRVAASAPALWRMQALDYFDGSGWTAAPSPLPTLPQPGGRRETITVRVLGLRQDLVVAPGRVNRVYPQGSLSRTGGEAWQLAEQPRTGSTYRVVASAVRVGAERLARDRAPLDPRASGYTHLGFATQGPAGGQLLGWFFGSFTLPVKALTQPAVDARVAEVARRVMAGARTEWDKVARVERYLTGGGRFRYTTHVPPPGPQPLVDFLLRTHAGYCEHFAGAAALLLRLAGVPVRVIAGFATGTQTGGGQYTVRDLDAHDWIEVYFPGYGWVPFNPTPAASPARVAAGVDLVRVPALPRRSPQGLPASLLLSALPAGAALVLMGRRARRRRHPLPGPLELIAMRTAGPLAPSTTLTQLGAVLAVLGPRTAALAAEAERARFSAGPPVATQHTRTRVARALVSDVGPWRALLIWAPLPRRRHRAP